MRLGGRRFVQQAQVRSRSPPSRTRLSHSSEVQDGNCRPSAFRPPPASARRHQEDTGPLGTRGPSGGCYGPGRTWPFCCHVAATVSGQRGLLWADGKGGPCAQENERPAGFAGAARSEAPRTPSGR